MPPPAPEDGPRRRATFADPREIDAFAEQLGRFERGELDAEAWRAYRVARGAYGQRQGGVHMLRVKLPQGAISSDQLRALADVASRFSRGAGHVTTRQNLQLYFVEPRALEPAMARLAEAGLTTSGAGGNTVRNVIACPRAGVSPDEPFDVTPYAEATTRHFLRHPLGDALPRKFKVAFEGCPEDHVATAVQDLGFRARLRSDGAAPVRGFSVTLGGGTSTLCTSGAPLVPFLPAGELLALAEAVVRVFHARGDRVNRQRSRLKHLVRAIGLEPFRDLVRSELDRVRAEGAPALPFDPERPPAEGAPRREATAPLAPAPVPPRGAWDSFRATGVAPQRQAGYVSVSVALPQGEVTPSQLEALAGLAEAYGDGSARFTTRGHVLLRWVRGEDAPGLFAHLVAAGIGRDGAGSAADAVACPGDAVCRHALTDTREAARAIEAEVRGALGPPALAAALPLRISGCPNGCALHHVAAIGLQGSLRRVGGLSVPHQTLLLGGHVGPDGASFGRVAGKVPASRAPEAVRRLVALYLAERAGGEAAGPFFARSFERARAAVATLGDPAGEGGG